MTQKIVLLDIDGTLLDANYRSNCHALPDLIRRLQRNGYMFALNSNRSFEDIVPVAERFSIAGPLIAENGVFYASLDHREPHLIVDQIVAREMEITKHAFEQRLKNQIGNICKGPWTWVDVDTVALLSSSGRGDYVYPKDTLVFANNRFRHYTTSVHVMVSNGKTLVHAASAVIDALCDGAAEWASGHGFVVARGYEFSNILAYSRATSKQHALSFFRALYGDVEIIGIGNEIGDADMVKGIGTFYAVANAMEEAKTRAAYVSKMSTTRGVEDVLRYILNEGKS